MASTRLVVMSISKSEPFCAEVEDAFDGDAAQGEVVGELAIGDVESGQICTQPGGENFHANCSRKRRSPEYMRLMSVMPYFIMAMRSMPMPKAKPLIFLGS